MPGDSSYGKVSQSAYDEVLARLRSAEQCADTACDANQNLLSDLLAAQAKLSEVERVLVKVTELVGLISTTTGDWQSIEQANRALDLLSPYR
jgi:fructose-1-phosphate kinase PfkB-like protein